MQKNKRLLIVKWLVFLFAFVVALLPSTIARSSEVNSRIVVEMVGVDGTDEVELTAQYVMPAQSDGSTEKDKTTVKGKTLTEAAELLPTTLGRRADFGQCSVVVVGRNSSIDLLGTLMTATDVTADAYLISAENSAKELVGDLTEYMKKSGVTDAGFIAYSAKKGHIATTTLLNFLSNLNSASKTAFMPIVTVEKEKDSGSEQSKGGDKGGGGGGSQDDGEQKEQPVGMKVEKLVLYNDKGKSFDLDTMSARGVAWVSAPIEHSQLSTDVDVGGETVKGVAARMLKKSSSISVDEQGNAKIKLKVKLEPHGDRFNIIQRKKDAKLLNAVKISFEQTIENEVRSAYENASSQGYDPLFVGRQFYRFCPNYFNKGFDMKNVSVSYEVCVKLK